MKKISKLVYLLFSALFIFYLALPNPGFPEPLPDALQSGEPADTEDPLRRSYFTDYDREGVLDYYQEQFARSSFWALPLPTYRLNYPPEESQTIIRDQARSTYLEEIVHPFRESLFVNGFGARTAKDAIFIEDKLWKQKITVKYIPSSVFVRVGVALFTLGVMWVLLSEWKRVLMLFYKNGKKRK